MESPTDIVAETRASLRAAEVPASHIAREAGVRESWLRMFMRGKIPNPGIRQFSRVRDYLDSQKGRA